MKKCSICKKEKENFDFPFQNKKINKLMSACKKCKSIIQKEKRKKNIVNQRLKDKENYQKTKAHRVEYAKQYRKKYPERTRATNLKMKYGITQNDYEKMLYNQEHKCAICSRNMNEYGKIFCIDHNHITGEIRGLLCDPCNFGLGFYEKHKEKYIQYLKKYNG